jgi:two-component system, sensor histidine kinase PdtaS
MIRIFILIALFFPVLLPAQPAPPLDSVLNEAGRLFREGKQLEQALELYLKGLRMAETEQRSRSFPGIFYNVAAIHHHQKDYAKSREYANRAIYHARAEHDSLSLASALMLSGVLHYFAEQPDSSVLCFRQSAAVYEAMGDQGRAANALSKVGNILEIQEKYTEATPYFTKQFDAAQASGDSLLLLYAHVNLATNAFNLKAYARALEHQQVAQGLAQKFNRSTEYLAMLQTASKIYEGMGKPEQALDVLKTFIAANDSVLNTERSQQIATLEAQYESEKKEATIAQQQRELRLERTRFWLIAGALLAALLVGALLFRLTRILRQRNAEKEFLIKEIHHRVKNNLQILSSLLHLQSRQIQDEAALDAVREGQNRVEAMSLIHQKLYMGDNIAAVEMPDYLRQLGDTLLESFGLDERVHIRYEVAPLRLDVDTAIPLGLIINELVTNSLKYAFPDGRTGTVEIALWQDEHKRLCLQVSDDGTGKTAVPAPKQSTSFGTNLVQMLSQKLKGKPEVLDREAGYATLIRFENFKMA